MAAIRPFNLSSTSVLYPCTLWQTSNRLFSGLKRSPQTIELEQSTVSASIQETAASYPKLTIDNSSLASKGPSALPAVMPPAPPPTQKQIDQLHDFIVNSRRMVVLTGAGVSTESGIPDYRSPKGAYSSGFKPMTHQDFVRSASNRKRYWARSYVGWRRFIAAQPGDTHKALARLEAHGRVKGGMITQNVDRLHHAAGSSPIELHGTTHETICLQCNHVTDRHTFQHRLQALNVEWAAEVEEMEKGCRVSDSSFGMKQRPDGDIEIDETFWQRESLTIPDCEVCNGILKPNVVFFGDNLPKERAVAAQQMVAGGDALLVLGSSLMVLSAFRLVRAAQEGGQRIAVVTVGPTRADGLEVLKVEARCGEMANWGAVAC